MSGHSDAVPRLHNDAMLKTLLIRLICLTLVLGLNGCQGKASTIPCPFGPKDLSSQEGNVTFELKNQSCTTICRIYLGAPSCEDWGGDLLLEGQERIPHGSSYSIQILPGKYDLMIEDCTETMYNTTNLNLREGTSWTFSMEGMDPGEACEASLTVVNESPAPVCHMWIADPESNSFGNNWLENNTTIPPGSTMTFAVFPGRYDVKAEDCDFNILRLELDKPILDDQIWAIP